MLQNGASGRKEGRRFVIGSAIFLALLTTTNAFLSSSKPSSFSAPTSSVLLPRRSSLYENDGNSQFGIEGKGGGVKPLDWMEEVRRKSYEVRRMMEGKEGARLQDRLDNVSLEGGWRVARALKRNVGEPSHYMSVIAEIKRRTPTGAESPIEIASIFNVADAAIQLADCGADVLMINTDGPCYGGSYQDLIAARQALKDPASGAHIGPPIVAKELIIHPIQVAKAVDCGADGVLLMACLLGASMRELLDTCTCLGTEALVEVHTVAELEKALELGATNIVATNWDRVENTLYPDQVKGLKYMIPDLIVSIAAGGISKVDDAATLADLGYDAVILGRGLANSPDIQRLISTIRAREGIKSFLTPR